MVKKVQVDEGHMMEDGGPPELLRLRAFLADFYEESDRGAVLMAASVLDEVFAEMVLAFLADTPQSKTLVEGFIAPLGTFASRILAAYSLGLIDEREFAETEAIRKIRNEFGHSWRDVSFETPKVKSQIVKLPFGEYPSRQRLNSTVANLLGDLLWRKRLVSRERRKLRAWPNKSGFNRTP